MAAPSTRNIIPLLQFGVTPPAAYVPRSPGVDSGFGHFYWQDHEQTMFATDKEEEGVWLHTHPRP